MRLRPRRSILEAMKTTVVLGLRLDEEGRCLRGEIRSQGDTIAFEGWLGLFAALDRLLAGAGSGLTAGATDFPEGDPR
jgi:hypothetical protein